MGRRKSDSKASCVPHFIVAKRIMEERYTHIFNISDYIYLRDKYVSKLKGHIESLREQLYNCEADLEKASSAVEAYRYCYIYEKNIVSQILFIHLSMAI